MLNSRDISLLRDDVEANCRTFITLCAAAGNSVLVTGTVRDDEYQQYCASHGLAAKTATRPTFHSVKAGLAFDICQNIKGQEYNDAAFWKTVLAIARKMGFTCGADWTSFPDKPHIQWDNHGKYTSSMILARKYPPAMAAYKESEDDMDEATVRKIIAQVEAEKAAAEPSDTDTSREAREWAEGSGILTGYADGTKRYKAPCTREQMVIFLHRLWKMLTK